MAGGAVCRSTMHKTALAWMLFNIALVGAKSASACLCVSALLEAQFRGADAVFTGIPVAVRGPSPVMPGHEYLSRPDFLEYTFIVTHVWKGDLERIDSVSVWSHSQSSACGYRFEIGTHHVVYASERKTKLFTDRCSHTGPVSRALWEQYTLFGSFPHHADIGLPAITKTDLFRYLESPDYRTRREAVYALVSLEDERDQLIRGLARTIRDERLDFAMTNLSSSMYNSRRAALGAARTLRWMGSDAKPVVPVLVRATRSRSNVARAAAVIALSSILEPDEFFPFLIGALSDRDREVRMFALDEVRRMLRRLGEEKQRALSVELVELFDDPNPSIRQSAIESVGHLDTERDVVIPALERVKQTDTDKRVRRSADVALRRLR